jgi:hypothetical protein
MRIFYGLPGTGRLSTAGTDAQCVVADNEDQYSTFEVTVMPSAISTSFVAIWTP